MEGEGHRVTPYSSAGGGADSVLSPASPRAVKPGSVLHGSDRSAHVMCRREGNVQTETNNHTSST